MAVAEDIRKRPIRSDYYLGKKPVKTTASTWAHNAIPRATMHMQWDDYDADRVEIYDSTTGKLYAVLRSRLDGTNKRKFETIYETDGLKAIKREKPEEE